MQKLILGMLVVFATSISFAQQGPVVTATPNIVKSVDQCDEFRQSAWTYEKKAQEQSIYAEKYLLISANFMKMFYQCKEETQSQQKTYSGYRNNAVQQQQIQQLKK